MSFEGGRGLCLAVSNGGLSIMGRREGELIGNNLNQFFSEEFRPCIDEAVKKVLAGEQNSFEAVQLLEDGSEVVWSAVLRPIFDKNGIVSRFTGIFTDVSKLKRTSEALQKNEEFIKNILETVDEGFIVVDKKYKILSANTAFCNSVNMSLNQVLGRTCHKVSRNRERPCFDTGGNCPIRKTFETGKDSSASHTHTHQNGTEFHYELKAFPIRDATGEVVAAIETITDITERKNLEEQLRHAQKLESVGTLAGGIAHDFNNILTAISGYGEMIEMRMPKNDPNIAYLREMLAAAERAAHLTGSLLIFSRKQSTAMNPVRINALIEGIRKMMLRLISEDIETSIFLAPGDMLVLGDQVQLEQVLLNFVTNARDAMPEGGSLSIETGLQEINSEFTHMHGFGKPGMYALISVSDTGEGMDEKTRGRIFEPFFTTKDIGKGTGLGLSIVYGIVEQHHGYINCYSKPGIGTTFKVYLPIAQEKLPDIDDGQG